MARTSDVATFSSEKHAETVSKMRERREAVHAAGEDVYRRTGKLHENVDIHGKKRVSRNSMTKNADGTFTLKNGVALPILSQFDGTGSMGGNVEKAFNAIPVFDTMLGSVRTRYNTQIATGVMQDVVDRHPVFQMSQFESDNRFAEQMRYLVPDKGGGDSTEDYDLGLAYLMGGVETDIFNFYGLKGYAFLVADEIGRGNVTASSAKEHLGLNMQNMSTKDICTKIVERWHQFYIHVGGRDDRATDWWSDRLGANRIVVVPDPDFLAEVQAGLIYVTETLQPDERGFINFITVGGANRRISPSEASKVWKWLQSVQTLFGAQAKLPNFNSIPMPGSIFADYRDRLPSGVTSTSITKPETGLAKKFDWSNF